jgi:hypothetical protein
LLTALTQSHGSKKESKEGTCKEEGRKEEEIIFSKNPHWGFFVV